MTDDRLEWHLDNWADWMKGKTTFLRYPSRAAGPFALGRKSDFDEMVEHADTRCAFAIDALIEALPRPQRLAVYHVKLYAVFRLPRLDVAQCYADARVALQRGLTARGIF